MLSKGNLLLHGKGSNEEYAIRIEGLTKTYRLYKKSSHRMREALHPLGKIYHKEFFALRDVSFSVKKGEILGIVGRNGAGKSTLLQILSGVLEPSAGIVDVRGNVTALLELGTGFNPELTGLENIYFHGTIKENTHEEMDAILDDILAFADIGEFIHQPLKTYSSGMRARLGFAVAVHMDSPILILDEVLAVGDDLFKRKCFARMEELFRQQRSVIFVSHSIAQINEICDRAILLDGGECLLSGPASFVTRYYHKLIYATGARAHEVRAEIQRISMDRQTISGYRTDAGRMAASDLTDGNEGTVPVHSGAVLDKSRVISYLIPDFVPQSTTIQRFFPVDVEELEILAMDGEPVNVLTMSDAFTIAFRLEFHERVANVMVNVGLVNVKGVVISGYSLRQEANRALREIEAGEALRAEIQFTCSLLPGTYFIGVAVSRMDSTEGKVPLINVNDMGVFRVIVSGGHESFGLVNIGMTGDMIRDNS